MMNQLNVSALVAIVLRNIRETRLALDINKVE